MSNTASGADRILIVDDEPDIVALTSYHMDSAGYQSITALSGQEAIEKARLGGIALVILDLMLPDMSGYDVMSALRADPATANSAFLLLTVLREDVDRIRGLSLGADDYLTKPFNPDELVLRVGAILRRARAPRIHSSAVAQLEVSVLSPTDTAQPAVTGMVRTSRERSVDRRSASLRA